MGRRREEVVVIREDDDEDEGWWLSSADTDTEVSDWRVCSAAIWVGSERRVASMAERGGGL